MTGVLVPLKRQIWRSCFAARCSARCCTSEARSLDCRLLRSWRRLTGASFVVCSRRESFQSDKSAFENIFVCLSSEPNARCNSRGAGNLCGPFEKHKFARLTLTERSEEDPDILFLLWIEAEWSSQWYFTSGALPNRGL